MKKRAGLYFLLVFIVIASSIYLYYSVDEQRLSRTVSYYGSIASVLGIIITLIEVYHAEKIARNTKEAVKKGLDSFHKQELQSTIIGAGNDCMSILELIDNGDLSSVKKHSRGLQDKLIVIIGEQNDWISKEEIELVKSHSLKINLDINSIERSKEGKWALNIAPISKNYEDLRTLLKRIEQTVKNSVQKDYYEQ